MARILVIDDSASMREVLETCLPELGHSALTAPDGENGLTLADPLSVDLVLLDVEMPRMNGISVCEALTSDPARSHIPVLMMTGRPSLRVAKEAHGAGARAVLAKPFTWDELVEQLNRHLPVRV